MGQAKKRGTFEERQAVAIQRNAEAARVQKQEFARRREAELAFEAADPKVAERRRRTRGLASALLAAAAVAVTVTPRTTKE